MNKIVVVSGSVISGLGKGITASSIGLLLQASGLSVSAMKIDPYLNVDAGTMSPYEHGECYVLADGGEADLDMGNYERFLNIELSSQHNITSGQVYSSVIQNERNGKYLGKTVQIIPHITNEIQRRIEANIAQSQAHINIIELGGVVGDIETLPFTETLRQLYLKRPNDFCFVHVGLIIDNGEPKTKPIQHGVSELRKCGINAHVLVVRTKTLLDQAIKDKLYYSTSIPHIICNVDVPNIYYVPQIFHQQNLVETICSILHIPYAPPQLDSYNQITHHFESPNLTNLVIGIAGKYTGSLDAYLSLVRAIEHASFSVGVRVTIQWINAEQLDQSDYFQCDGIIIPGGFGQRGIQGKMSIAQYCWDQKVPLLGICLGMQIMTCQFARTFGIEADSTEWCPETTHPLFMILPGFNGKYGGTMRLGNHSAQIKPTSQLHSIYQSDTLIERHRHRYEFNNAYRSQLEAHGLVLSAVSQEDNLVEVIEHPHHPFYLGCQFHPEYRTRYDRPHPLFVHFLKQCLTN